MPISQVRTCNNDLDLAAYSRSEVTHCQRSNAFFQRFFGSSNWSTLRGSRAGLAETVEIRKADSNNS
jgi:hypothetical protein